MKKIMIGTLTLAMVLVMVACGSKAPTVTDYGLDLPDGLTETTVSGVDAMYMADDGSNINIVVTDAVTDLGKINQAAFEESLQAELDSQLASMGLMTTPWM